MPSLTSCVDHPKRPAVGTCPICGQPRCERCMTYRGTKYVCKSCAPSVPAGSSGGSRDPFAPPGSNLKASVEAEQEQKAKPDKSRESRYKRSRYGSSIALRQAVKKLLIVGVLLVLGILAYLPLIAAYAVEDSFSGAGYLDQAKAPQVLVIAGRIHLLYGRDEEAIDLFDEYLEQVPEEQQAPVYFYLGEAYMALYDFELASKQYGIFLRRWPTHDLALEAGLRMEEIQEVENKKQLNRQDDVPIDE